MVLTILSLIISTLVLTQTKRVRLPPFAIRQRYELVDGFSSTLKLLSSKNLEKKRENSILDS